MFRIGQGFDVHQLVPDRELWLCGVRIPNSSGLLGHSDADVALHALCDALLGAVALGDIGKHFPDSDPEYKGIDSKILLRHVYSLIVKKGYHLVNCDITVCAQKPKIAPYIDEMKQTLARILLVSVDEVSVKGTTTEHLGFTGREEGIAAMAVVLLAKN